MDPINREFHSQQIYTQDFVKWYRQPKYVMRCTFVRDWRDGWSVTQSREFGDQRVRRNSVVREADGRT